MSSKQHVQVPNDMTKSGELSPKDLLVYATIKSHMNNTSKSCFPSLNTIAQESGISRPTVIKSIEILKKLNYFSIKLEGRKNVYTFNSYKNFEPFSVEFLKSEINSNIKAFLIASQQYMFKDVEGIGKLSYSDTELSKIINLDRHTIAKYNKELEESGFLTTVRTNNRDPITGIQINEKFFHLDELDQAIIWELQKHEEKINKHDEEIHNNSKETKLCLLEIDKLKKEAKQNKILKDIGLETLKNKGMGKDEIDKLISGDFII